MDDDLNFVWTVGYISRTQLVMKTDDFTCIKGSNMMIRHGWSPLYEQFGTIKKLECYFFLLTALLVVRTYCVVLTFSFFIFHLFFSLTILNIVAGCGSKKVMYPKNG
jgi:hypothetical protein